MAKRKETLELEEKLRIMCLRKRIYGCGEVTIGFYNNGHGDEIVDYCTMDSKGILRCYEIKVTLADLKSKAKKSWYGHYNYLFVTTELYGKIKDSLSDYIPDYVGVATPCSASWSDGVEVRRNAKKQNISQDQAMMMKESMIRSMYYKIEKYKQAASPEELSRLKSKVREAEKDSKKWMKEATDLRWLVDRFERILRIDYGRTDLNLSEIVDGVDRRKLLLPEKITLFLTERGKKYNERVREETQK